MSAESRLLSGLAHEALAWASVGRDRFVADLRVPEFKKLYLERTAGEPVLLVYGRSQVGKSELILRLLGLDLGRPEHAAVKDALRGGRELGSSASATATVYRTHEGSAFHLRAMEREWSNLSVDDLRRQLVQLRALVEGGRWPADGPPVEISIPRRLVDAPILQQDRLTILDLPGVGSATQAEKPHVERLLRRYLPVASVVILVYPGMQLARLGEIDAPELQDWECDVARFRVVLTRAISPGDVQARLREPHRWSLVDLRGYYLAELRKTVPTFPDKIELYPVEFGDSWRSFRETEPNLHARLAPEVDQELARLAQGLPEPTPEQQLIGLIRAHTFLEARADKRKRELSAAAQRAAASLGDAEQATRAATKLAAACAARVGVIDRETLRLPDPSVKYSDLPSYDSQGVADFMRYLSDIESEVLEQASAYLSRLVEARVGTVDASAVRYLVEERLENELDEIRQHLASWTLDTYIWGYETEQRDDRQACRAAADKAANGVLAMLQAERERVRRLWQEDRTSRIAAARIEQQAEERQLGERRRTVRAAEETHRTAQRQQVDWEKVSQSDLYHARSFRQYLCSSLDDRCDELRRVVHDPRTDVTERLGASLSILLATHRAAALDLLPRENK